MKRYELFWRNVWLMLRRGGTRWKLLGSLFYLTAYFLWLIRSVIEIGWWGALFEAFCFALAGVVVVFIMHSHAHADQSLMKLSTYKDVDLEDTAGHRPQLVAALLQRAAMVDRAGFEALHRMGKVPEEQRGICRRRTLDVAQRAEVWSRYSDEERGLLMAGEGAWEWKDIVVGTNMVEDVRVLRWVIQMDEVLTPFEFLQPDLTPALEVTVKPQSVEGTKCLPPWDLRPARQMAVSMFERCLAEGLQRGFLSLKEGEAPLLQLAERYTADQSRDLLTGKETVARTDEERIRWIGQIAMRRAQVLNKVIRYLGGPAEVDLDAEDKMVVDPSDEQSSK